jgi:outer membrane biosynthesis protein TonB
MRRELSPAMIAPVLLHVTVAVLLLVSWPWSRDLKVGQVVPVTIVANAPSADLKPAEQAPVEAEAATEAPIAEAPPEVVPPAPEPTPTPPPPKPAPAPAKAEVKPAPQKPAKPEKSLDFAKLEASLSKMIPRQAAKPSSAPKGPTKAETALQARETEGTGLSAAAAMTGLADELQRRWNPNCGVVGGREVMVRVTFVLGPAGSVIGEPAAQVTRGPASEISRAAADRAVRAVYAAAPFRNLPREFYGERIVVNFNAREACS